MKKIAPGLALALLSGCAGWTSADYAQANAMLSNTNQQIGQWNASLAQDNAALASQNGAMLAVQPGTYQQSDGTWIRCIQVATNLSRCTAY